MIIPTYWSSAKKTIFYTVEKSGKILRRRKTFFRFGWSSTSQKGADFLAEQRLQKAIADDSPIRRETKVAYNGAEGLPIREEIVASRGDAVVTRNSYGALCLNTPDVLILDVDTDNLGKPPLWFSLLAGPFFFVVSFFLLTGCQFGLSVLGGVVGYFLANFLWGLGFFVYKWMNGGVLGLLRTKTKSFAGTRWRFYKTPNGYRLFETSRRWAAKDKNTADMMNALLVDPLYLRMCVMQDCFRARVSPKPWRAGVGRLRSPLWPVSPEKLLERQKWVEEYNRVADLFASCKFLEGDENYGDGSVRKTILWHDEMACRKNKPLA